MKLTDQQLSAAIGILTAGKAVLSKESPSDYVVAASFIFDNGLMFFPGVALDDLKTEQVRRAALQERTNG